MNNENKFYHKNNSSNIWIFYTKLWARVDFLNTIYKTYDHYFYETIFDIIRVRKWWFDMKKNIKHFVRHCFEYQLTIKFKNVKRNVIYFNEIWFDRNQFFEKWNLNFIDSLFATIKNNRWIIICIDYNIKWFIARVISNVIVEVLTNFIFIDVYKNYEAFKKIIIDRKTNLWTSIMKLIFEFLNIKHKKIISYHFRTNDAIKQFNDVLNHMFRKYCINKSIKNWNFYLNQILFVIKIRTHIIIDFFLFVVWN